MINKLSILVNAIGISICLFSLFVSDSLLMFGLLAIFISAVAFTLNWKNGLKSVFVAIYMFSIVFVITLSNGHSLFQHWYIGLTLILLPVLLLYLGCVPIRGTFVARLQECLAYILCIVSVCFGNLLLIVTVVSGA